MPNVRTPVPHDFRITRLPVAASPVTADGWHRGAPGTRRYRPAST